MTKEHVLDRFLRYVQVDTQADPNSTTTPSSAKQKNLGRMLVAELQAMGIADAHLDENGYVYATLPANTDKPVPVICYCSHMDTSPDSSGTDVKPIVHRNYDGRDLALPDDPQVVIRLQEHPDLGLAEIMTTVDYLLHHPEITHGAIKILFTPDEEIGRGVDKVDLQKLGAQYGYTVDGENRGSLEDETFSADGLTIVIEGVSAHPGFAKGHMESAIKAAGDFLAALPKDRLTPESTEGREGFVHPVAISGGVEQATLQFIIRDFDTAQLAVHEAELKDILDRVMQAYPRSKASFSVKEQYRNMKEVLDKHPQVVAFAEEAIRRAGMQPKRSCIRGGTDGSRLSFMGLPCPNVFAGEHAFHSRQEWVSVQDMEKAVDMLVQLAAVWAEKS